MNNTNIKQTDLAKEVGIHHVTLNAILRGRKQASVPLAILIEQKSGGAIKAADLRQELKYFQNEKGEPSVDTTHRPASTT